MLLVLMVKFFITASITVKMLCVFFLVSSRFGFGLMDAGLMTWYATGWKNVPPMCTCESAISRPKQLIPSQSSQTFILNLIECKNPQDSKHEVNYIEQVQVFVSLATDRRGEIEIYLYSPSRTRTQLLPVRRKDHISSLLGNEFHCRDENVIKAVKVSTIGHFSPFNYGAKFLMVLGN